jgi:hypothetical protein
MTPPFISGRRIREGRLVPLLRRILRGGGQRPKISAMSEDPTDLILEHLRAIRGDIAEIKPDLVEIKQRLGRLEA